jgi:multidrug efflux system membrane fusion protein
MRPGICAIAAALLVIVACQNKKPPEAAVQTVRAGTVEEIHPDAPERYSAIILPSAQVDLAFKSAGLIEKIHQVRGADGRTRDVQAGDSVAEGTELAVVRKLDYEQRVQQAQEQIGQAEAQLAQAEAVARQAEQDFKRAANLFQTASLTKPEYDQARARFESTTAQVSGAKWALETARTAVSEVKLTLSDTSVRAPFTGWVIARNVERGSLVGNSTVGFSMVDTHLVKAVFAVPDTSLKRIRPGQRLTVLLDALLHPAVGTVTAISPQADPKTHVFSVEVSVMNPKNEIRPGMIGSLALGPVHEPQARVVVPLSAVVRAPAVPNGFAVFRLEDRNGKTYATAENITVGSTFGNSIEVTSGARAGERIVALGGEFLRDGQEVRVLP